VPDRACLTGVIFVLKSGIQWEMLPQEMNCGSGMTCWRRLRDWSRAGVWEKLQHELLNRLRDAEKDRLVESRHGRFHCAGEKGGAKTGPTPTNRGKPGTKRHLVTERQGIPLAELTTAANVHETTVLERLLDAIPPVRGKRGRPQRRPGKLYADKAYRSRKNQQALRRRRIKSRIARPKIESSEKLGRHRWVVERSFAWLDQMRRLQVEDAA
jgi:transposase